MIDTTELRKELNDPTIDKGVVIDNLVKSIDDIVLSNKEMKRLADEAATLLEVALNEQKSLFDTVLDYTEALKNIHLVLSSCDQTIIDGLKLELAKWVLNPQQVKLGVISHAKHTAASSTPNKSDSGTP